MKMHVKHVAGGTRVGGAVFRVRLRWRPWDEPTFVRAIRHESGDHEYECWAWRDEDRRVACLHAVDDIL
jgi:hypothetical protein